MSGAIWGGEGVGYAGGFRRLSSSSYSGRDGQTEGKQPGKELTKDELKQLKNQTKSITEGDTLEALMKKEYPNARITVIRGLDTFEAADPEADATYTKDAYFNMKQAEREQRSIPLNGDREIADRYALLVTTPLELLWAQCPFSRKQLDSYDRSRVYENLLNHLHGKK
ncbi:hypothetical protein HZB02_00610 [Candidatus Woesearchaeota archaeon]|nr:hypothetical protein [Candidatus Woesearchaeota archaeon]